MNEYTDAIFAALALSVALVMAGSIQAMTESAHLFEPQWKREARELSRWIPTGDDWGR